MALTTYLSSYVLNRVRSRGASYYRNGAVQIIHGNKDEMQAIVFGTNIYEVELTRRKDMVYVSCTCPYFQGERDTCKHIWAALLSAEEKGYLKGKERTDPLHLRIYDEDAWEEEGDSWDVEEWEDEREERPLSYKVPYSPHLERRVFPKRKQQATQWKEPLTFLRSTLTTQKEKEEDLLKTNRQILYLIDIPATLEGRGLVIEVAYRQMKRNGQWGKIKSYPSSSFRIENITDPDDQRIIALLIGGQGSDVYHYGYRYPGYYGSDTLGNLLPGPLQNYLMELICRTGRCFLRKANDEINPIPLMWDEEEPWEFCLAVEKERSDNAYHLKGYLERGKDRISLDKPLLLVAGGLVFFEDKVSRFLDKGIFGWIFLLRNQRNLLIPLKEGDAFIQELMTMPLLPNLSLPEELQYEEIHLTPRPMLKVRAPERKTQWDSNRLNWDLLFDYEGHIIPHEEPARGILIEKPRHFIMRDLVFEKKAFERLRELGFREIKSYGYLRRDVAPRNIPQAVRELLAEGWHVEAEGKVYRRPGAFRLSVSTGIDWFELHGEVQFEDRVVKLPELLRALKRGEHLIPLDDGTFGMVPEEWLKKYGALTSLGTTHGDHLRFSRCQAGLLDALLSSQPEFTCDELFQRIRDELRSFEGVSPCDPPKGFIGQLRDYQKDGLGWIHFLEKFGFGGCLADDMGLGKTIQVLAMLEERRERRTALISEDQGRERSEQKGGYLGPSLVVAPKSLVFNWIQEAKRFTPQLKVLDHTGSSRLKPGEHFENYDLILTTYGTLRKDVVEFKHVQFDYCILDEGQMIKNADTQSAKATRLIKANHRLVLSGTPIENHLGELWSLFEFLNPGMLGSASVFKLTGPGSRHPDSQTKELLGKALRPFILRRTKGQVASELPEKFEQTLYCELESKQRKLYNELRDHYRQTLLHRVKQEGINKSKIQILEALLRLRQAACHPGLIDRSKRSYPSTKLEILLSQLEQVMEEHKALVFSQFTSFLAILREQLEKQMTPYTYLDGQTRNRKEVVERFQKDPDCRLFLISLKAGGLGLNLTEAEYVYLLDPWWNPAVETQAVDRTHRIGQTRKVFAYRIIAKETVEEKVLELQQTKRGLAEAIINVDNSLIRNLSKEDLELLLS